MTVKYVDVQATSIVAQVSGGSRVVFLPGELRSFGYTPQYRNTDVESYGRVGTERDSRYLGCDIAVQAYKRGRSFHDLARAISDAEQAGTKVSIDWSITESLPEPGSGPAVSRFEAVVMDLPSSNSSAGQSTTMDFVGRTGKPIIYR